jgi:RNase P/RNase MRP subunit p29
MTAVLTGVGRGPGACHTSSVRDNVRSRVATLSTNSSTPLTESTHSRPSAIERRHRTIATSSPSCRHAITVRRARSSGKRSLGMAGPIVNRTSAAVLSSNASRRATVAQRGATTKFANGDAESKMAGRRRPRVADALPSNPLRLNA